MGNTVPVAQWLEHPVKTDGRWFDSNRVYSDGGNETKTRTTAEAHGPQYAHEETGGR